ncbi:MAG TPA: FAD-dependent monooxygenase [Verrucomicrobiae bacterium]
MKPITIIGGGLAGLTLGIALRKEGVPVTIYEAGQYPRHRVCGEFLSGEGLEILRGWGIGDAAMREGAREAKTVKWYAEDTVTEVMSLPKPALCISRYRLDGILAEMFVKMGGHLLTGSRYTGDYGQGVVRATGRQVQTEAEGWRWIGIKAHATGVTLEADLEMHLRADAYVGMCQVENDRTNICGLFRTKEPIGELKTRWEGLLLGGKNYTLTKKLKNVTFDKESLSFVAGLPIKSFQNDDIGVLSVGDSSAMIPPVTGNGMSLAVESGRLASEAILGYSMAERDWGATQALVHQSYVRRYGGRLRWAGWLQEGVFHPLTRKILVRSVAKIPGLFRWGFGVTRE